MSKLKKKIKILLIEVEKVRNIGKDKKGFF